jgi:mannose-6-phosphate isomerase-like protein (cupin superfamily)
MQVLRSGCAELAPEYGILAGRWERQYRGTGQLPFGAMWCVVPPGGRADTDRHPERELVVVVQGSAAIEAAGRTEAAPAGTAVLLDSQEAHVLANASAEDPLVTLSLYWEPDGAATSPAGAVTARATTDGH